MSHANKKIPDGQTSGNLIQFNSHNRFWRSRLDKNCNWIETSCLQPLYSMSANIQNAVPSLQHQEICVIKMMLQSATSYHGNPQIVHDKYTPKSERK